MDLALTKGWNGVLWMGTTLVDRGTSVGAVAMLASSHVQWILGFHLSQLIFAGPTVFWQTPIRSVGVQRDRGAKELSIESAQPVILPGPPDNTIPDLAV